MINGIIVKGIGGFYYVRTKSDIVECRARGVFREEKLTPLVGDKVRIRISDEDNTGYIEEIYPRTSKLLRPPVANITQAIIVMSIKRPDINPWLLDRFIIMAEHENLDIVICINKSDLAEEKALDLKSIYKNIGYKVINTSIVTGEGIDELKELLNNNISVFAGPSGAGKSSLLNTVNENFKLETGNVSFKTKRGKHTTRHIELLELHDNTFVLDSPGFSSLNIDFIEQEIELKNYFREIYKYGDKCRFISCLHKNEPNCEVKKQVEEGNIRKERYENYLLFLEEIKNIRRY
ncbi:ribosome biogenesis GTPase [Tissierella praeacuta DSM 18095]|uniref:Small ribosomal subunit biogenesis GTPase RsgA n=1 Tax=Tissierella praeacuta DSM 18095 TaxID=1123404 RepID=A0A1M4SQE1_9FIRM|nr:ribosome small subunit-dependent GTPase A [Tissierella praeacuta]SHE34395.1 ribosome biogenesis GTPase [Tissierella praeacuta DSM 18095]SUP01652.1 Putative ribosome biogenesis GTPase RsgA [Tissierella praeacuta]